MAALAIATPVGIPALKSSSVRSVRRTTRAARPGTATTETWQGCGLDTRLKRLNAVSVLCERPIICVKRDQFRKRPSIWPAMASAALGRLCCV
eukprot:scaffold3827_cov394-Prasinococcus_capsulatus_cf.AAC.2